MAPASALAAAALLAVAVSLPSLVSAQNCWAPPEYEFNAAEGCPDPWDPATQLPMTQEVGPPSAEAEGDLVCLKDPAAGCTSLRFPVSQPYTRIRGRVTLIGYNSNDAFYNIYNVGIDDHYLDGASVTINRGAGREHVFSLAVGMADRCPPPAGLANAGSVCPAHNRADFFFHSRNAELNDLAADIGDNFYCESTQGAPVINGWQDDLLFDNVCGGSEQEACCGTGPATPDGEERPYWEVDVGAPTDSDIELRLCTDQGASDENVALSSAQFWTSNPDAGGRRRMQAGEGLPECGAWPPACEEGNQAVWISSLGVWASTSCPVQTGPEPPCPECVGEGCCGCPVIMVDSDGQQYYQIPDADTAHLEGDSACQA